eukprot:4686851-Alexandrium_andersonii.AAC.1
MASTPGCEGGRGAQDAHRRRLSVAPPGSGGSAHYAGGPPGRGHRRAPVPPRLEDRPYRGRRMAVIP